METKEELPLRWPEGWGRTLIDARKSKPAWKKPYAYYNDAVLNELRRAGAGAVLITRNDVNRERMDPGVAVWYSLQPSDDFSWQSGLALENPAPTLDEIDAAFRRLIGKNHPDQINLGSGGDIEVYKRLVDYRKKAKAWVLGQSAPVFDNCLPFDKFKTTRENMAAAAKALKLFRGLDDLGMPAILQRVMDRAFKAALPAPGGANASS